MDTFWPRIPTGYDLHEPASQTSSLATSDLSTAQPDSPTDTIPLLSHERPYTPLVCGLFTREEAQILGRTLKCALSQCDFGGEIVIRLLNDKRSLFKSLLARCTDEADNIEVFSVSSMRKTCPRAASVSNGVTLFFIRALAVLENGDNTTEDELCSMSRANGRMHYRMKVWFQAENFLCVKRSIVDTILMANAKNRRVRHSAGCARIRSYSADTRHRRERHNIEATWMKLMGCVISWMKQGFLEAALSNSEEDIKL
ncbi:hypothetical protein DdX_02148 [Ditylenchus destructor]|uniref:Uncharacterized protein n=1 Tax=Ditylenchus destructor TaxID=166010 RepID=A0AAD4NDM3_9BILA|nr:hypothetical protein DdX_02148 [Ditylenchus destructor]